MKRLLILLLTLAPELAAAFSPQFPTGATETAGSESPAAVYRLPLGPWTQAEFKRATLEGPRRDRAWRLKSNQLTTTQIIGLLREQIVAEGYDILFECETQSCGGFDFRYETFTLPEPAMHVDLGDFRFLSARRGSDHLGLLVSRSSESGFVQLTELSTASAPAPLLPSPAAVAPPGIGEILEQQGHVALDDLSFESGATTLGPGPFPSLEGLAAYLTQMPFARIALVGHTDTEGSLEANVAVSRRRAEAVRERLIQDHGVAPERITAEGAGWLAPRTGNLTPEGRMQNRRVEAVLTTPPPKP